MYTRVIPRDLFNEAKLLKCLGQLSLLVHDGVDHKRQPTPPALRIEHDGDAFYICQIEADGGLYCTTVRVFAGKKEFMVSSRYNSKQAFPLQFDTMDDNGDVFNDDGTLTSEFVEMVNVLAASEVQP